MRQYDLAVLNESGQCVLHRRHVNVELARNQERWWRRRGHDVILTVLKGPRENKSMEELYGTRN